MQAASLPRSVVLVLLSVTLGLLGAVAPDGDGVSLAATAPRVGVDTGPVVGADLASTAAAAVSDAFVVAGISASVGSEAGGGGAVGGGDQVVAAVDGRDIDPVIVALVALVVFLFGVALISGIQLWRGRGSEEVDGGRYADLSRKERRRARRTDKAVQAAERKTAKEIDKAEKRAAKLAPDPDPVARPAMVDGPPTPSRKARKAAERAAKAEAKAAKVSVKRHATLQAHHARQEAARAKTREKQAKADAKGEAKRARADDRSAARSASESGPAASGPPVARSWPGDAESSPGRAGDLATTGPAEGAEIAPETRAPLFAATPAAPVTAGPFLESLFVDEAAKGAPVGAGASDDRRISPEPEPEPGPVHVPEPEPVEVGVSPEATEPVTNPVPAPVPAPVVSAAPAEAPRTSLEAAGVIDDARPVDLSDQVARQVPPPKGLRGRRKAKRRVEAAEHRHRQLRAITAILDVPPLALPPAPVRRAIGMASAASVASPDEALAPGRTALGSGSEGVWVPEPAAAPGAPTPDAPRAAEPPAVPWPGDADTGDPAAWPRQPR